MEKAKSILTLATRLKETIAALRKENAAYKAASAPNAVAVVPHGASRVRAAYTRTHRRPIYPHQKKTRAKASQRAREKKGLERKK